MRKLSRFPSGNKAFKKKRGAILFMAAGAIAVLSILALGTSSSVLQELKVVKLLTDTNTSWHMASSVASAMTIVFAHDETPAVITRYDLREREIPFGNQVAQVTFTDEQGKINIDTAWKDVLLRFPSLSDNEELINAILAANLYVKEELLLIEGMTQEIYDQIKNLITTVGSGTVNINTATEATLSGLGMDADLISKIKTFRAGDDVQEGTKDDHWFSSTDQIIPLLEPYVLTIAQRTFLEGIIASGQFAMTTDYVTLHIDVKKPGITLSRTVRSFDIVLNLSSGRIVSWSEL